MYGKVKHSIEHKKLENKSVTKNIKYEAQNIWIKIWKYKAVACSEIQNRLV